MMFPVTTGLDLSDAVVCADCGHPIWDPLAGESCARCDGRERAAACSLFLLNDFVALAKPLHAAFSLQ